MIGRSDILSAHPLADLAATVCSRSGAGKTLRFCMPAVLSAALLWPTQSALADFIQSGTKFAGTGGGGNPQQGNSVALSADGNTLIVGGPLDSNNAGGGAVWVFTRSGNAWTQ